MGNGGIDRVLGDFIVESQENLDRLDHEFVALEHDPENKELLASIFRTIHTIKGSAGFLNLTNLEQVSHYAEDVLAKLRDMSLKMDADITTTLLQSVDCIKSILLTIEKTSEEGEHDVLDIVMALKNIALKGMPHSAEHPGVALAPKEIFSPVETENKTLAFPHEDEAAASLPLASEPENGAVTKSSKITESVEQALSTVEDSRIHVDVRLLDQLMNLTGELVLSRNQVLQFVNTINERNFRTVVQRMNVVVSELQEIVMKTRMQPIKKVFGMFPRLVRDLSKLHGKDVQLRMEGQNTELDKTLIEAIKDPLTHLVRNAIDHGIEFPHVRKERGKPATGTIAIHAYHEGGQVNIEVSDDGMGLDLPKIKAKAIQERFLTPHQAEEISERNLIALIFQPGFSTAEKITNISGRGVGMDVVKKNIDQIGGIIDVQTERYRGTVIKLRIPITLAIIPVLIVKSGEQRFAIPQVNLEELLMIQTENESEKGVEMIYGAEVYRLRGELLPLLRLNTLLNVSSPADRASDTVNIVVVSSGDIRFGMIVDEVGDTEEIVVKPLSKHIKQITFYDGATIMGDGKVALILNVNGLFQSTQLNLEEMKKVKEADLRGKKEELAAAGEQHQTIVLFKVGKNEYYGVPLAFVIRLEKFPASQIEYSAGREVLQYRKEILPLIRLEQYLNIPTTQDPEMLSLIVFSVERQVGLVVKEIIDTVEIGTHIDTETFKQKGMLGSTIVQEHSVIILDIHGLIEMAYPTWYKKFFVSKLSEADRKNTRLLLVEDSPFFLNIERSYFEAAGYHVLTAINGQEAQEKLKTQPIDVIVTDIDMPVCNGYELTKNVKANDKWKQIPIMALTALSGEKDREKGREAGVDEYQIKLDRDEVLRALELLILRTRRQYHEK